VRVLILNRRDIHNPQGGGAERYTHEVAKGLRQRGCQVVVFSSRFPGSERRQETEGVLYIRRGSELTVHLWGLLYALRHRRDFDFMIEEFNGLGFFTFLVPARRRLLLVHQLYREFWFRELGLLGAIPYVLEPLLLRCYRGLPAVVVSASTGQDLRALGFRRIHVVLNALSTEPLRELPQKSARPTLMFLGRLRATKRPEDALKIFRLLKEQLPQAQLWMVGSGPMQEQLRRQAPRDVVFYGWVGEQEKLRLLRQAHVLLVPSVREGFGINVLEAASQGTPAVGYDVPGLRDSIRDGQTGFLARGPQEAAQKALRLLTEPELLEEMGRRCLSYSRDFNWRQRAEEFWAVLRGLE
jgi:glycosyltransferase involved in cell wall biosynthesis